MSATLTPERIELGRFLTVSAARFKDGHTKVEMFSGAIDAEWHQLLDSSDYAEFCTQHAGQQVGHVRLKGSGEIAWVTAYEALYGSLPEVWFTDAAGEVDIEAVDRYRTTGVVVAEWDCSPIGGGDGDDVVPEPREIAAA
ncbi:hypothetical protein [Streptomyces spororaveus]|uniref:hypothetical protein n=1 Tax=Streptomyces spororaveus TaxID=284039 RepID=UPI0037AB2C5F